MKRYLLFDSGCTTCSKIANRIEGVVEGHVEIRSLHDRSMQDLLKTADMDWQWRPTLLEVKNEQVKIYQGIFLRLKLVSVLGLTKAISVFKLLVNDKKYIRESDDEPTNKERREFLRFTSTSLAGLALFIGLPEIQKLQTSKPEGRTASAPGKVSGVSEVDYVGEIYGNLLLLPTEDAPLPIHLQCTPTPMVAWNNNREIKMKIFHKKLGQRVIILLTTLVLCMGISGCNSTSLESENQPIVVATVTLSSQPISTLVPTAADISTATVLVEVSPVSDSECDNDIEIDPYVCLPSLTNLAWEYPDMSDLEDYKVRQISDFRYPIVALDHSPTTSQLVVTLETDKSRARGAVALIDDENSLWLAKDAYNPVSSNSVYDWLTSGELIWANDEGKISLIENEEKRDLDAPVPMFVPRAAKDGIAFGVAEGNLWRSNLESKEWEQVPSETRPEVGGLGNLFGIANDGTYGLSFQASEMWRVPSIWGSPAESLPGTNVVTTGSDSGVQSPRQLGSTDNWLIDIPITEGPDQAGQYTYVRGLIVSAVDGHQLEPEEFAIPETALPHGYSASKGGEWLAIILGNSSDQSKTNVYITSTNDLKSGDVLEGVTIEGWDSQKSAVIVRDTTTNLLAVVPLPFSAGTFPILLSDTDRFLGADSGYIFASSINAPTEILRFDQTGELLDSLNVRSIATEVTSSMSTNGGLSLGLVNDKDGVLSYSIIEWIFGE